MEKLRILLADDHALVRSGISTLLEGFPEFQVIGEAADGEEVIEKVRSLSPDVVILDLSMPKLSGVEATKVIRSQFPSVRVLVLTMHENEEYIYQILNSGAEGYILKSAGKDELATAVRVVSKGEKYFHPRVLEIVTEGYIQRAKVRDRTPPETIPLLTKREREILSLIGQGLSTVKIAQRLFISPRTVDTHRTNIMQKLDIHDAVNLVRYAIEHGFADSNR